MVNRAWSIVSFLAVAHLLAMAMFAGWLWQSNRLNFERINEIREMFTMTVDEAAVAREAEREERELALQAAIAEQRRVTPPIPSAAGVHRLAAHEEMEHRARRSIEQEKHILREQIIAAQRRLDDREAQFRNEQEQWELHIRAEQERRADEQFEKTVRQYESVRPRQGKDMLLELIANGQMHQAVAYLDAMNARSASRILGEFKTEDEIRLATELLEQLRRFGISPEPQEQLGSSNDKTRADAR